MVICVLLVSHPDMVKAAHLTQVSCDLVLCSLQTTSGEVPSSEDHWKSPVFWDLVVTVHISSSLLVECLVVKPVIGCEAQSAPASIAPQN